MHRLRTVTSLDVSAVAGHHAMPAALLLYICFIKFAADQPVNAYAANLHRAYVRASMCAYITFQDS